MYNSEYINDEVEEEMDHDLKEDKEQTSQKYICPPYNYVTISARTGINKHSTCQEFIASYIEKKTDPKNIY